MNCCKVLKIKRPKNVGKIVLALNSTLTTCVEFFVNPSQLFLVYLLLTLNK